MMERKGNRMVFFRIKSKKNWKKFRNSFITLFKNILGVLLYVYMRVTRIDYAFKQRETRNSDGYNKQTNKQTRQNKENRQM